MILHGKVSCISISSEIPLLSLAMVANLCVRLMGRVRVYGQHSQLSRCHVTASHTSRDITGAVMTSVMSLQSPPKISGLSYEQESTKDSDTNDLSESFSKKEWAEKRAC